LENKVSEWLVRKGEGVGDNRGGTHVIVYRAVVCQAGVFEAGLGFAEEDAGAAPAHQA
jgi:hypothetical protein